MEMADLEAAARLDANLKTQSSPESQFGQSLGRDCRSGTTSNAVADPLQMAAVLSN